MKSYMQIANENITPLLTLADTEAVVPDNSGLGEEKYQRASVDMYHLLLSLCRKQALDKVINAGNGNGVKAWRLLLDRWEPRLRSRQVGLLLSILKFSFVGDPGINAFYAKY